MKGKNDGRWSLLAATPLPNNCVEFNLLGTLVSVDWLWQLQGERKEPPKRVILEGEVVPLWVDSETAIPVQIRVR